MAKIIIVADKENLPILEKYLPMQEGITVIYSTSSLEGADNHIKKAQAVVLDVSHKSAGVFIATLKAKNIPIIAIADIAAQGFALMELGASEMQLRMKNQSPDYFCKLLAAKIKDVSQREDGKKMRELKRPSLGKSRVGDKLIVIGSSTGGTDTVEHVLKGLREDVPPILIVQHMPPIFTRMYAERLNNNCSMSVWEAREGDALRRGLALIAPGDYHMVLSAVGDDMYVKCVGGARVCNQRHAVDVLFESVTKVLGNSTRNVIGVILTGMGSDGANGLLELRQAGATTIGQDEESCVVYGMPRAAYECGAVQRQLHKDDIAQAILNFTRS